MTQAAAALLDRGLHYIHAALDALLFRRERIDSPIGFAVIYAALGIELVLKHRLFIEHWTLIFSEPGRASRAEFESGAFHSVSTEIAIRRLKDVCSVSISDVEKELLLDLANSRNRLIHFGMLDSAESAMARVGQAVHAILGFIDRVYPQSDLTSNQLKALKQIRKTGADCLAYVETTLEKIHANVVGIWKKTGVFRCSRCHQLAAFFKNKKIACLFCAYSSEDFEELLMENLKAPRRPNAVVIVEAGCCSDRVFSLEWKRIDGEMLEREKICFVCGKRIDFFVADASIEC